jgi:hypothetical protein
VSIELPVGAFGSRMQVHEFIPVSTREAYLVYEDFHWSDDGQEWRPVGDMTGDFVRTDESPASYSTSYFNRGWGMQVQLTGEVAIYEASEVSGSNRDNVERSEYASWEMTGQSPNGARRLAQFCNRDFVWSPDSTGLLKKNGAERFFLSFASGGLPTAPGETRLERSELIFVNGELRKLQDGATEYQIGNPGVVNQWNFSFADSSRDIDYLEDGTEVPAERMQVYSTGELPGGPAAAGDAKVDEERVYLQSAGSEFFRWSTASNRSGVREVWAKETFNGQPGHRLSFVWDDQGNLASAEFDGERSLLCQDVQGWASTMSSLEATLCGMTSNCTEVWGGFQAYWTHGCQVEESGPPL